MENKEDLSPQQISYRTQQRQSKRLTTPSYMLSTKSSSRQTPNIDSKLLLRYVSRNQRFQTITPTCKEENKLNNMSSINSFEMDDIYNNK